MYNAIDLFSGCGGMSEGIKEAGFNIIAAVENNKNAAKVYRLNHANTHVFECDIRDLNVSEVLKLLNGQLLRMFWVR